jgi:hypothetical protein
MLHFIRTQHRFYRSAGFGRKAMTRAVRVYFIGF